MKLPRASLLVGCLLLLQAIDLFLTWKLLSSPAVYESNPLALAVLRRHGWFGLSLFKVGCTAVVVVAALLLNSRRPVAAGWVLVGCCFLMAAVAGYSLSLLPTANEAREEMAEIKRANDQIDGRLQAVQRFLVARRAICRDLLERRLSLAEAMGAMSVCIEKHRGGLSNCLLPSLPPADQPVRMTRYIVFHAERAVRDQPSLEPGLPDLRRAAARYLGARRDRAEVEPLVISGPAGMVTALVADAAP